MIRNEITQADYDAAILACAKEGERPTIGAVRARLKRAGFTDRDLRLQGFSLDAVKAQARQDAAYAIVEEGIQEVLLEHKIAHKDPAIGEAIALLIFVVILLWIAWGLAWLVG